MQYTAIFTAVETTIHYVNVSVLIKFSQKTSVFTLVIIKSYVLNVY